MSNIVYLTVTGETNKEASPQVVGLLSLQVIVGRAGMRMKYLHSHS